MTDRPEFEFHPLADFFPILEGEELQALADDIKEHGQRQPIVMHEGKVLDGRNRYLACRMAETEPEVVDYDGTDALSFVVSLNWKRRHLNTSQRAMVAPSIANMRQGERTDVDVEPSAMLQKVSQSDAAGLLNVSERTVQKAASVREHGESPVQASDGRLAPKCAWCDENTMYMIADGLMRVRTSRCSLLVVWLSFGFGKETTWDARTGNSGDSDQRDGSRVALR